MLEISILKIQDPSCFWGRIIKGAGLQVESSKEYENLQLKMNLFYHGVNLDAQMIKLPSLAERQVCVVYSPTLKSWCRAVVESIFEGPLGSQVMCFLVDYAEHILVSSDSVRAPLEKFLQLQFRVRKFQLAGIHPMRLQVPVYEEKAKLVPSTHWDCSATRYLHNLVQASSLVEALLCGVKEDCTVIELYLTIGNVKICVNDDLVTKKFACFSSNKASPQTCRDDSSPVMLACDIYSNTSDFIKQNGCISRARLSTISPRMDLQNVTQEAGPILVASSGNGTLEASQGAAEPKTQHSEMDAEECRAIKRGKSEGIMAERTSDGKNAEGETLDLDNSQGDGSHHVSKTETDASLENELLKKLNLFRFMKFLNPVSKSEVAFPKEEVEVGMERGTSILDDGTEAQAIDNTPCTQENPAAPPPGQACAAIVVVEDEEVEEERAPAFTEQQSFEEELACARLLQLLNPDPLNPDAELSDNTIGGGTLSLNAYFEPSRNGILFHSAIVIDPCTSLVHSPITDNIRKDLVRKGYSRPGVAECYCWPAVARGCDTVLISSHGAEPLTYIPPFLSHLHLSSACDTLTSRTGPIAVILCHGWEKAQCVFDLLEEIPAADSLHPMIVLVGQEKDAAKSVKIQRNCQVLVTTPFTLVRLLGVHCFLFLRLCYLVLDEVDLLFSQAPEEMGTALQHFQRAAASEERSSSPRQVIAVGKRWCKEVEDLLKEHMSDPCIIITIMEEAALYGGVHQMVLLCLDCNKISVLLGTLDFIPDVAQKTLIITNSVEEVENVFKAVNNTAAFCLRVHEGLTHQFDFIVEQWRKDIGPGTHVILVITNECIKALGIQDATCVVHYGFPTSPKLFGSRLSCMSENFQNLSDKNCESLSCVAKSVLLLSERDARHMIGVLRYLERTEAVLPSELLHFAQGVLQAKEEQKTERPLCSYLKCFGFCRDSRVCPDRHQINPWQDAPQHPDSGNIKVLPLYIKNASCYYGRKVNRTEDCYENLAAEMMKYYNTEKFNAKEVVEGGIYGIQEDGIYHRIQVLAAPDKGERLFCSVKVHFLDEGREQEVKAHQLLMLPSRFQSLPPQALEIIVCRAKPIDGEMDWNPKVNRCISQKIKGLEHQAKVVLSLGNTVWLDPMVRITRLPGLKTSINEYNVRSEILATGMGTSNPEHIELLRTLFQEAAQSAGIGGPTANMSPAAIAEALECKLSSAEEALANQMKALECKLSSAEEALANQKKVSAESLLSRQEVSAGSSESEAGQPASPQESGLQAPSGILENGVGDGSNHSIPSPGMNTPVENELGAVSGILNSKLEVSMGNRIADPDPSVTLNNGLKIESLDSCETTPATWLAEEEVTQAERQTVFEGFFPKNLVSALSVENVKTDVKPIRNITNDITPKRFHPHIKWFEREDLIILNVKLPNPTAQECEFFPDRVVYRACVNDRHYYADLELCGTIVADKCTCDVKCNEPMMRLMKEEKGAWNMLLKQKNAFVTFDFDHFEEDEPLGNAQSEIEHWPASKTGRWFMECTGEEGCYGISESESDSD